jgi:hypothetical protein
MYNKNFRLNLTTKCSFKIRSLFQSLLKIYTQMENQNKKILLIKIYINILKFAKLFNMEIKVNEH